MKVNNRRRVKMSKRTSAIIVLCVALVLTLAVGYLGLNGAWLDSRGISSEPRHIKEETPSLEELRDWAGRSGLPLSSDGAAVRLFHNGSEK